MMVGQVVSCAAATTSTGSPMSVTARLAAAAEARAAASRARFGIFENNANDTARQLLFRGEKRRRYCVIVGDLQNNTRQVTLKLFGHKGAKPFKLQNKLIRLVNLSIGKPRRGTLQWRVAHGLLDDDDVEGQQPGEEQRTDSDEEEEQPREQDESTADSDAVSTVDDDDNDMDRDGEDAAAAAATTDGKGGNDGATPTTEAQGRDAAYATPAAALSALNGNTPPPQAMDSTQTAAERAFQNQTHAAAGFDVEEIVPFSSSSSCEGDDSEARQEARQRKSIALAEAAGAIERAAAAVPIPESNSDDDGEDKGLKVIAAPTPLGGGGPHVLASPLALASDVVKTSATTGGNRGAGNASAAAAHADPIAPAPAATSTEAAATAVKRHAGSLDHHSKGAEAEGEDVDHYLDNDDEVVPLTVQQAGAGATVMYETSLANSPVLTAKRFASLRDYFLREFRFLLSLEDVRSQNVSVKINLGAAYCCLARQGSYSTPLKHATFGEFVERMNTESMQLYFIKDCPACVSRAVDMESGSLHFPASSTTVKINFFSNERQSRSIARAVWDSDADQFRLLDVENIGVTFNWSVFSLDETFVRRKNEVHAAAAEGSGMGSTGAPGTAIVSPRAAPAPAPAVGAGSASAAATEAPPLLPVPTANKVRVGPAPVAIGVDPDRPFQNTSVLEAKEAGTEDEASAETVAPAAEEAKSSYKTPIDDDEDDLARNKTVAYPFEVEFRAYRRWKQQGDNPAAPLAKAILEELSLAEHNYLIHGSTAMYERMDLTNVCEVDYAAEDLNVESIVVEHTSRVKPEGTDLLVDNTTSLFIENFAAARQLKEKVTTYGPIKVAAMQNPSNNNFMRSVTAARRAAGRGGGHGARDALHLTPAEMAEVLKPTSKLTFFRSRGSTIHWKLRPNSSLEENIAPMTEALSFLQQVLHTANEIERNSARGGAAPDAL
ncbi:conserved hypothetical protein [Leishmania major strain Friedlin]|uniref:Uncharacterized protein n=1 Tax=Leishmania major TaxID=5664 RepID=Q4Q9B0_LEIMA|nr:conserved hypothetical protein [Leishmania major strain Friedlin]CAJ04945.1 conserved hypothetical protein [Leishmania major strain Friedlin]|eukprot:XP_001684088.1 conserved hypothetical protein [Leishmania major strain Friedlin]